MSHRASGFHRALLALPLALGVGCTQPVPSDIEVEVRSVGVDSLSRSPVVVLQDKQHRTALPIWIGPGEAQAIAMQIEGVSPPRPLTHDLMRDLLVQSGVEMDRVVIGDLKDRTYFARIHLTNGGRGVEVDSRPSDAIALAVRLKKPIFVARSLMAGEAALDVQQTFGADTIVARGISVQALSDELAEILDVEPGAGVLVSGVPEQAGELRRGDILVAVDGTRVDGLSGFADAMRRAEGAAATLEIERQGQRLEVQLPAG